MIVLLTTTDTVKLSAVKAVLRAVGIQNTVFDAAAGTLWTSIIPMRLMILTDDELSARRAMFDAGRTAACDGEWDYVEA